MSERGAIRWGHVIPAVVIAVVAVGFCGTLGWWQWQRAHEQATTVAPAPSAPIAEILEPASPPSGAVGRQTTVTGQFAADDAALVGGRAIDGEQAVLVVRPFTVDAADTGTGEPATLAVIVGWADAEATSVAAPGPGEMTLEGYLRASEGAAPNPDTAGDPVDGAFWAGSLSPAVFAQHWDSPLYSVLLVAHTPEQGLNALPEPAPETSLNFRSLAYAGEWWLFGAFFAFICARWIRDNGRERPADVGEDDAPVATASAAPQEETP